MCDALVTAPRTVDIETAGRILGVGRSTAYELARRGEFPCRVLKLGHKLRVPIAEIEKALGERPDATEVHE